jgi:hypothetical protein
MTVVLSDYRSNGWKLEGEGAPGVSDGYVTCNLTIIRHSDENADNNFLTGMNV